MTDDEPNPHRECIFCKARGMTYEHVWQDWLKQYVPQNIPQHRSGLHEIYKTHFTTSVKTWSGDPQSRRLRVVCGRCNGGWMKELQDAAKPRLLPLLDARPSFIRPYDQKIIAAWAAMCVMTAEYYQPDLVAIPFEDRDYLRLYREPPKNWKIWIGRYLRGQWKGYWTHHSVLITENIPDPPPDPLHHPNTQTTTFVVGQLYIQTFSCALPKITDKWSLDRQGPSILSQLWPVKESFIAWPTNDIRDSDAYRISGHIFWQLEKIASIFGH